MSKTRSSIRVFRHISARYQVDALSVTQFAYADAIGAMIVELALGTGQRPSDLPKMRWDDYDGEFVRVVTSKAGKEMWIPPTERLKAVLERAKTDAKGLTR